MNEIEDIKEAISNSLLTDIEIAKRADISRQYVYLLKTGKKKSISLDIYNRIMSATGGSSPKKKGVKIPVLGVIPAGVPIEAIEEIIDYEEITEEEAKKGEYFGLLVKGDSMFPTLLENDVVIVRKQESAESNDVCAVLVNGYDATLKRIRRLNTGVVLVPDNKSYEEKTYSNADILNMPVRILGRVIEVRRKM